MLLPLVGALWAFASLILPLVIERNRIRDKVLTGSDGGLALDLDRQNLLLYNDWKPLGGFLVFLCFAFGLICVLAPHLLSKAHRGRPVWAIVSIITIVTWGTGFLWCFTAPPDYRAMRLAIAKRSAPAGDVRKSSETVERREIHITSRAEITVKPPFRAEIVAASHSALSGLMAGFALAGLFLLLQHTRKQGITADESRALLLLFVAFLSGGLSAYLYSSLAGDPPQRAYYLFTFPSAIFALHVYSLIG